MTNSEFPPLPIERVRDLQDPTRHGEWVVALACEVEALRKDKARLDWLEGHRIALNRHYGTSYGWKVVISHNVTRLFANITKLDVNDANANGTEIRAAIDTAMETK